MFFTIFFLVLEGLEPGIPHLYTTVCMILNVYLKISKNATVDLSFYCPHPKLAQVLCVTVISILMMGIAE